jgi:hypothetical protein
MLAFLGISFFEMLTLHFKNYYPLGLLVIKKKSNIASIFMSCNGLGY